MAATWVRVGAQVTRTSSASPAKRFLSVPAPSHAISSPVLKVPRILFDRKPNYSGVKLFAPSAFEHREQGAIPRHPRALVTLARA